MIHNFIQKWKESMITGSVIIAALSLFSLFPANGALQEITISAILFFVLPTLYVKYVLKEELPRLGMQKGSIKSGFFWATISLLVSSLIFYLIINYTDFEERYSLPSVVYDNFWLFLAYELFLNAFFITLYEFFFRGFVMFNLAKQFSIHSFWMQFLILLIFFLSSRNFNWSVFPFLITGFFSGITTYKSKSLVFSIIYGISFVLIADAVIIRMQ